MIQMKNGVYGTRHFMKRASDGPFSLSKAEEARLVARGVAEYVDGAEPPADGEPIGFNDAPPVPEETGNDVPVYDASMSAVELRKIAADHGVTFRVGMTKKDMVAALDEHFGISEHVEETSGEDEEDAPSFNAADAVQ